MTYTRHGHHIPGTTRDDELGQVDRSRCGGVAICTGCQQDLAYKFAPDLPEISAEQAFEDTSEYASDPDRFLKQAKLFAVSARNNAVDDNSQQLTVDDLYIVWFTKALTNWKALISTSISGDGLYFEVTHNGEREETYVDTYLKIANDAFSPEGDNA